MAGNRHLISETISEPDYILKGEKDELIALKYYSKTVITSKHCVVIYREVNGEGFVITAFLTSKPEKIKGEIIWQKQ